MDQRRTIDWPGRVAVVGAGAMGSVLGAAFAAAGVPTVLIDRRAEHVAAIAAGGLFVSGVPGERHVRPEAATSADGIVPADLVVVLTDSASTRAAAETARALLAPDGLVLTLQNGIGNGEILEAAIRDRPIVVGSTYNSAAYLGPGRVLHSNAGETVIGALSGPLLPVHRHLAACLTALGFPTAASPDVAGHVWLKFALNCALNPVAAATGLRPGEIYRIASARALTETILDEIAAVIAARAIRLPVADLGAYVLDHARTRYNRPSMLQHVEAGLEPELGALNEALMAEGARLGVPTPVNRAIAQLVRAVAERHRRRRVEPALDEAALEAAARAEGGGDG